MSRHRFRISRRARLISLGAALAVTGGLIAVNAGTSQASTLPPVGHVFVIQLENKNFDETWGPNSAAPYLSKTLRSQGLLLTQYYGIGHNSLDNYIAQLSGQSPNAETQADCQIYSNFVQVNGSASGQVSAAVSASTQAGGVTTQTQVQASASASASTGTATNGQVIGQGCVYPSQVHTLAGQLSAAGKTWKGYMEDMGTPCRHPVLNTQDQTQKAQIGDQYAVRHNPYMYFHEVIDSPDCQKNVVDLNALTTDLQQTTTTPNFSYITPNLCSDGHDSPCVDGRPGGLASADAWLQKWVPVITSSPAFQEDGMLVITSDESDGPQTDSSACCGEGPGPNVALPGLTGLGGGRIGALVISPHFVQPNSWNDTPYNHYSLLASIEDLFGLPYLGYAGKPGLPRFGTDVYNRTN
ncbi:alkaline phosphatase family protein [Streptomyces sp. CG1]|uniref:alkaline phosphatase family protein n=1 Tax=Streptomyces sp. CG1 TaxID=1287523 RepID=UPI0034E235C1